MITSRTSVAGRWSSRRCSLPLVATVSRYGGPCVVEPILGVGAFPGHAGSRRGQRTVASASHRAAERRHRSRPAPTRVPASRPRTSSRVAGSPSRRTASHAARPGRSGGVAHGGARGRPGQRLAARTRPVRRPSARQSGDAGARPRPGGRGPQPGGAGGAPSCRRPGARCVRAADSRPLARPASGRALSPAARRWTPCCRRRRRARRAPPDAAPVRRPRPLRDGDQRHRGGGREPAAAAGPAARGELVARRAPSRGSGAPGRPRSRPWPGRRPARRARRRAGPRPRAASAARLVGGRSRRGRARTCSSCSGVTGRSPPALRDRAGAGPGRVGGLAAGRCAPVVRRAAGRAGSAAPASGPGAGARPAAAAAGRGRASSGSSRCRGRSRGSGGLLDRVALHVHQHQRGPLVGRQRVQRGQHRGPPLVVDRQVGRVDARAAGRGPTATVRRPAALAGRRAAARRAGPCGGGAGRGRR